MATFQNFTYNPPRPLSHQSPSSNPDNEFAIFSIAVLTISATAFLLLIYYFFTTRCYLRCQRQGHSSHVSRNRVPGHEDQVRVYPYYLRRIDEFLIQEIPAFLYIKNGQESSGFLKCVSNSNFPLCRSTISCVNGYRFDKTFAPNYLSQEDFVVIEVSGEDGTDGDQEISDSSRSHSARNLEQKMEELKKSRTCHDVSVIDVREKYGEFSVPAIRRSLSLDSVFDLYPWILSSMPVFTMGASMKMEAMTIVVTGSSSRRLDFSFGQGKNQERQFFLLSFSQHIITSS